MHATRLLIISLLFMLACTEPVPNSKMTASRWTVEQAAAWEKQHGWLRGSNFAPSTAVNELEMWQAETFDTATIDRELGWAESLGFNSMRVFLHNIPWTQDSAGFIRRIDQYLSIAHRHGIGTMLVLFDGVWNPEPYPGKQPDPKPHVHNSGWVQAPGKAILMDTLRQDSLRTYVQGIVAHFANDTRIDAWDLFNEPENMYVHKTGPTDPPNKAELVERLLRKTFIWARETNPSQPLTAGLWTSGDWSDSSKLSPVAKLMIRESDIMSFHCYDPKPEMNVRIQSLKKYGRPVVCTEYMARPNGSTFTDILPLLKETNTGAYNWGFVAGKTNTIYPWDSWDTTYTAEPPLWFHDIFRADGTPYKPGETELIKQLTGKK